MAKPRAAPIGSGGSAEPSFFVNAAPKSTALVFSHEGKPGVHLMTGPGVSLLTLNCGEEGKPFVQLSSNTETQFVPIQQDEDIVLTGLAATETGAEFAIHNDLGIPRVRLAVAGDGGVFGLNWGGHAGVVAAATEKGGMVAVHDSDGRRIDHLPGADAGPDEAGED